MRAIDVYNENKLTNTWLMFILLGWSYGSMGKMGKQIFFYLTIGGFGLWTLYVLFTLSGKIKAHNRKVATASGLSMDEVQQLGLM